MFDFLNELKNNITGLSDSLETDELKKFPQLEKIFNTLKNVSKKYIIFSILFITLFLVFEIIVALLLSNIILWCVLILKLIMILFVVNYQFKVNKINTEIQNLLNAQALGIFDNYKNSKVENDNIGS